MTTTLFPARGVITFVYLLLSAFLTAQPCPAGTFSSTGMAPCTDCPVGRYSATEGATECTACAPGEFAASPGSTTCTACEAGRFAATSGATACADCEPGTYAPSAGSTACTACEAGRFAATSGATECTACAPGEFAASPGATECSLCSVGRYSAISGTIACTDCEPGFFSSVIGASSCLACGEGTFTNFSGASACTACDIGTYNESTGATLCMACPEGFTTLGTGSTSSADCAVALPVILLYFDLTTSNNNEVNFIWETSEEVQTASFTLAYSRDGIAFREIAKVPAKNSSQGSTYNYQLDEHRFAGRLYFRLHITDYDGSIAYSPMIYTYLPPNKTPQVKVSPNPAHTFTEIELAHINAETISYQLINSQQQVVASGSEFIPTEHSFQLPTTTLPSGAYTLQLIWGAELRSTQIIVQH